jgi:hypothetical protein
MLTSIITIVGICSIGLLLGNKFMLRILEYRKRNMPPEDIESYKYLFQVLKRLVLRFKQREEK